MIHLCKPSVLGVESRVNQLLARQVRLLSTTNAQRTLQPQLHQLPYHKTIPQSWTLQSISHHTVEVLTPRPPPKMVDQVNPPRMYHAHCHGLPVGSDNPSRTCAQISLSSTSTWTSWCSLTKRIRLRWVLKGGIAIAQYLIKSEKLNSCNPFSEVVQARKSLSH